MFCIFEQKKTAVLTFLLAFNMFDIFGPSFVLIDIVFFSKQLKVETTRPHVYTLKRNLIIEDLQNKYRRSSGIEFAESKY